MLRPITAPGNLWRRARLGSAPIRRPFAPGLHLLLALDQAYFRLYLTPGHLEEWGASEALAWQVAMENLHPSEGLRQRKDGSFVLDSPDGLASSRLCLPGWLAAFRGRFLGEPLAAVPCGRRLLVGGESQAKTLYAEAEALFRGEGEPVSPHLYQGSLTMEGTTSIGTIDAWAGEVPESANAERWFRQRLYAELGERLEEEGKKLAPYRVHRRLRDGLCLAFAPVMEGVLYPEVDVLLLPGDQPLAWRDLPLGLMQRREEWEPPVWEPTQSLLQRPQRTPDPE